jgi:hypothetical protein
MQGGWRERPAEIAPRSGADPSNLWGNPREGKHERVHHDIRGGIRTA